MRLHVCFVVPRVRYKFFEHWENLWPGRCCVLPSVSVCMSRMLEVCLQEGFWVTLICDCRKTLHYLWRTPNLSPHFWLHQTLVQHVITSEQNLLHVCKLFVNVSLFFSCHSNVVLVTLLHSTRRPLSNISCKLNKFQLDKQTNEISPTLLKLREDEFVEIVTSWQQVMMFAQYIFVLFLHKKNNMQTLALMWMKNINFLTGLWVTFIKYESFPSPGVNESLCSALTVLRNWNQNLDVFLGQSSLMVLTSPFPHWHSSLLE